MNMSLNILMYFPQQFNIKNNIFYQKNNIEIIFYIKSY